MVADGPSMLTGLHRQCLFGGLRIGLYEPVKTLYMGKNATGPAPFYKKARKAVAPCMQPCGSPACRAQHLGSSILPACWA